MKLFELLTNGEYLELRGDPYVEINGIRCDSRKIMKGDLFVEISGTFNKGQDFRKEAIERGAVGIVSESLVEESMKITTIKVADSRNCFALLSSRFFASPSKKLKTIAVTGTNGKTSFLHLLGSILNYQAIKYGLLGTLGFEMEDLSVNTGLTTPDSFEIQSFIDLSNKKGAEYFIFEASSHGISQHRLEYTNLDCAVFTNLGHDHLDYHKTVEAYFAEKEKLFTRILKGSEKGKKYSIINIDDSYGKRLAENVTGSQIITYSMNSASGAACIGKFNSTLKTSIELEISFNGKTLFLESPLIGLHNGYNILATVATALALNIDESAIINGLKECTNIRGRLEQYKNKKNSGIFIDFAHTPDGLVSVLNTLKTLDKRIITVFGCGGNRDKTKRSIMGEVASRYSYGIILTNDNPRDENPKDIIEDITKGINKDRFKEISAIGCIPSEPFFLKLADRAEAIKTAYALSDQESVILLAGKGHENYMEIKGTKYPFSEKELVEELIRQ